MPINFNDNNALKGALFSGNQQNASIDQLLRSIGSLNAQSLNLFRDSASARGLPEQTRLAQERAIGIQGNQAASQGIFDITQFFQNKDSEAARFLLNQNFQKELQKNSLDAQKRRDIFNLIGQVGGAAGFLFGGGAGGAK
jgi:hypothetical protein